MYDLSLIEQHFPLDEFRPGQKECIEAILTAFNNGKRFVILEAPTGSGKSVIGMTVAKFFEKAYYLTIQKILQDQLTKDFTNDSVKSLKGRNAYKCNYWEVYMEKYADQPDKMKQMEMEAKDPIIQKTIANPKLPASEGVCLVREKRSKSGLCFPCGEGSLTASTCPYWKALGESLEAHTCIMNFNSFLYQTSVTDRFKPRSLMVIDEAHNAEPQLMDFVSLNLTDKAWRQEGVRIPEYDSAEKYAQYFDEIHLHEKIEDIIRLANFTRDFKKAEDWKKVLLQYKIFLDSVTTGDWVPKWENKGPWNKVTLKPIFVDKHANRYLFGYGNKILMMSATILQPKVIYDSLGIDPSEAYAYRMKNRFPVENRPIYFQPIGSMSFKNKESTTPKMITAIEEIANNYPDKRGIIHTHNFEIARNILTNCNKALQKRLIYQENYESKDEMLAEHTKKTNGIIIAPAMHEGLDLKHDLSRFQIICKIPYPSFQDNEQLKIRMQLSQDYYDWLTALKLVQSYGRSIRDENDWADTFILDQDFDLFKKKCHKLLPEWFTEVVTTVKL